ncbi:SHOCT domain-containing protein [Paraliobacillus sp. JSM ZJ581]
MKKTQTNKPLNILKLRLAEGEISEEEYERLKNKLDE